MDETSADGYLPSKKKSAFACVNAHMIQVNNEWVYEDLTYDSMQAIMK
jgi:NADH:ubiquinone oxidoreductase subunit E